MTAWVDWLTGLVDGAWPSRGEAAGALGVRPDELSKILTGKRMPRREWLQSALFPALHLRTGSTATEDEHQQARNRYMAALRGFEALEKQKPGKRRERRPSWQEYALLDRMREASRHAEHLHGELEQTRAQHEAVQQELKGLRGRWRTASAELERTRHDLQAVTTGRHEHQRQLALATQLVHDLEEQIQARELQRSTMLERIRLQQHQMQELRAARNALEQRLAELKARYAWRREISRRLQRQLDFKRQTLNLIAATTGMATATWLIDGFTIEATGAQRVPALLACVLGVGALYHCLYILVLPLYAAIAVPAAAAARRNTRSSRRIAGLIGSALFYSGVAAPFVLYPYMLWLSAHSCRIYFGLPISLKSGLPAVLAALVALVTAVLVHTAASAASSLAQLARFLMSEYRSEDPDPASLRS
ncbi:hypothetical protein [Streptomyces tuirus]